MTKNEFDTKQTVTSSEEYKVGYRRPPSILSSEKGSPAIAMDAQKESKT